MNPIILKSHSKYSFKYSKNKIYKSNILVLFQILFVVLLSLFTFFNNVFADEHKIQVGSKKFTESVLLAELAHQWFLANGKSSQHIPEIGSTKVLWKALVRGEIQIYPEYTGTLSHEILKLDQHDFEFIKTNLQKMGIGISKPLGFNNTYALGMKSEKAQTLNITKISDLKSHPQLRLGSTEEFFNRGDGWPGLKQKYQLHDFKTKLLDHDVSYRAVSVGDLDLVDIYSTDPDIAYYNLKVLDDDQNYFPKYLAVYIYNLEIEAQIRPFLDFIEGRISEKTIIELNLKAKVEKTPASELMKSWLFQKIESNTESKTVKVISQAKIGEQGGVNSSSNQEKTHSMRTFWSRLSKRTIEHLFLVFVSLLAAILFAIPLGFLAFKFKSMGEFIISIVSIAQTIPALALLVLFIEPLHFLGLPTIGVLPALIALFIYSLLPILVSTHSGLKQIPQSLQDMSDLLSLPSWTKILKIELPLAWPSIINGIKISAVLNVGFATLGALVGAGGYGQLILTGIRLDDTYLILQGAVPAALLALFLQKFFNILAKSRFK